MRLDRSWPDSFVVRTLRPRKLQKGKLPDCPRRSRSFRCRRQTDRRRRGVATVEDGRVEMWRGFCRPDISVSAPFVWRCLSGSTVAPFPHPAHRTGRADFPASGLYWAFFVKVSRHFCHPLSFQPFVRPALPSILPPRPHSSIAVARSGGQGRSFFSAAEGSSLTDARTAAGCRRSGGCRHAQIFSTLCLVHPGAVELPLSYF